MKKVIKYISMLVMALGIVLCVNNTAISAGTIINLNKTNLSLEFGETAYLKLNNVPASKVYNVEWSTDNASVTLSPTGNVCKVMANSTTDKLILVSAKYNNKTYKCMVTIKTIERTGYGSPKYYEYGKDIINISAYIASVGDPKKLNKIDPDYIYADVGIRYEKGLSYYGQCVRTNALIPENSANGMGKIVDTSKVYPYIARDYSSIWADYGYFNNSNAIGWHYVSLPQGRYMTAYYDLDKANCGIATKIYVYHEDGGYTEYTMKEYKDRQWLYNYTRYNKSGKKIKSGVCKTVQTDAE